MLRAAGQTIVGYQIVNPPGGCNCDLKLEVGVAQLAGICALASQIHRGDGCSISHADATTVDVVPMLCCRAGLQSSFSSSCAPLIEELHMQCTAACRSIAAGL